ncbi:MAG: ThuA domain-containing protein, partial [Bryobacteraceae bacterium]|nr:ThuA domain-containing protein [Bryobacteraceae bacterium]
MALRLLLLTATLLVCAQAAEPVRILLLTGEQGGPYHAWEQTNPVLKSILDKAGLFAVDVLTAPPKGGDFSNFRPEWSKYKAVVANYDAPDERWPAELKESFETYVRNGGGFVSVHAADNAFAGWRAYNLMIGIGGWRGRDEKSGPLWYYR